MGKAGVPLDPALPSVAAAIAIHENHGVAGAVRARAAGSAFLELVRSGGSPSRAKLAELKEAMDGLLVSRLGEAHKMRLAIAGARPGIAARQISAGTALVVATACRAIRDEVRGVAAGASLAAGMAVPAGFLRWSGAANSIGDLFDLLTAACGVPLVRGHCEAFDTADRALMARRPALAELLTPLPGLVGAAPSHNCEAATLCVLEGVAEACGWNGAGGEAAASMTSDEAVSAVLAGGIEGRVASVWEGAASSEDGGGEYEEEAGDEDGGGWAEVSDPPAGAAIAAILGPAVAATQEAARAGRRCPPRRTLALRGAMLAAWGRALLRLLPRLAHGTPVGRGEAVRRASWDTADEACDLVGAIVAGARVAVSPAAKTGSCLEGGAGGPSGRASEGAASAGQTVWCCPGVASSRLSVLMARASVASASPLLDALAASLRRPTPTSVRAIEAAMRFAAAACRGDAGARSVEPVDDASLRAAMRAMAAAFAEAACAGTGMPAASAAAVEEGDRELVAQAQRSSAVGSMAM